jgi:predicted transcriptional regulator of viral defense system
MPSSFLSQFCEKTPFNISEAKKAYVLSRAGEPARSKSFEQTFSNLIRYHKKAKHIVSIGRRLYIRIPEGAENIDYKINPFLIAAKLNDDAIIGYHAALSFWGVLHALRNDYVYLTKRRPHKSNFTFQDVHYKAVSHPSKLIEKNKELLGVVKKDIEGDEVLVTSLERTFVDILDRPYLIANDWEKIYRSFQSIAYLHVDTVIDYVLALENKTTLSRVGYFLDLFKRQWLIEDKYIQQLKGYVPNFMLFVDRNTRKNQKMIKDWNLMIPESLYYRRWEEPHEDI